MADNAGQDDDLLEFLDDSDVLSTQNPEDLRPWRVLIVDDDLDVHKATELAMQGLTIEGQPLEFLHASSGQEARGLLATEKNLAVALLDVVMESEDAGLQLVRYIREELCENAVRIVLRTGQPGYAPEIETVQAYDINDYKTKSELTRTRLYTVLTAAVRSYKQICSLESSRQGLEMVVDASTQLSKVRGLHRYADGVLHQLCALLGVLPEGVVCAQSSADIGASRVIATAGQFAGLSNTVLADMAMPKLREQMHQAFSQRQSLFNEGLALYFGLGGDRAMVAMVDLYRPLAPLEEQLLRAFSANVAVGFENVLLYGQLLDQAYNDQLLQLPNRNRFVELLDKNLKDPAGITLGLVDIDEFSDINDAFGHRFGDLVLQAVVVRLNETLGKDAAMARVGPDTFGVLGPDQRVCAETIATVFAEPFSVAGEKLQLSATSGLVRLTDSAAQGSELLLDAQIALKRAKQHNRGSSQYFSPAMGNDARERFKLLKGLRAGFEENRLFVVYQPQVDLTTSAAYAS